MLERMWRRQNPLHCWWECKLIQPLWRTVWRFLKKLGIKLSCAMATHPSTLAWKIPRTEEPGRLQSMGSVGIRHDWATSLSLFTFMHWRRKWQPTPVFLPGESQGRGSLVGAVSGVAQSWTRLRRLSSSSSNIGPSASKAQALCTTCATLAMPNHITKRLLFYD